jgi:hypothetical protein
MCRQIDTNDRVDMQDMRAADLQANDGLRLDEILERAQEIHREHGGILGYDFEDWVQAWGEIPERES